MHNYPTGIIIIDRDCQHVAIMKFVVSPVPTFGHKGNDLTKGQYRRLAHAVVDVLERALARWKSRAGLEAELKRRALR